MKEMKEMTEMNEMKEMKGMGFALVPNGRVRRHFSQSRLSVRRHFFISTFSFLITFISFISHLVLCVSCSSDESQQDDLEDLRIELRALTRADDESEQTEDYVGNADIHVFIASTDGATSDEGLFRHHEDDQGVSYWTAQELKVKPGSRTFSLFGFMPETNTITGSVDTDTKVMTLTGIEPMTPLDICVVTGVRKSSEVAIPLRGTYTFDYFNSSYNDRTILNLRLEHLLGRLVFKFKVGANYSTLRKIKVKELKIDTKAFSSITATINLPKLKDDVITVNYDGEGENTWESVLLKSTDDPVLLTTTAQAVGSSINVAVGGGLSGSYELVSTYDVYDLQGHKLSERTARNKLSDVLPVKSQVKEVVLTIEPTYLYQLGDDDLDNPTVTITN
jgi:hypothetical protein